MSPKTKSLLMLAGTLVLGVLLGFSAGGPLREQRARRFMHTPPHKRFHRAMERILRPSEQQKAVIDTILTGHSAKMSSIREAFENEMFALLDSLRSDLATVLDEKQLERIDEHFRKGPEGAVSARVRQLTETLNLDDEQVEKVHEILMQMVPMHGYRRGKDPAERRGRGSGMREGFERIHREIEGVLTQEQRTQFREMRRDRAFPFGQHMPFPHRNFKSRDEDQKIR